MGPQLRPRLDVDFRHSAGCGTRDFEQGLFGLQFEDDLIFFNDVALADQYLDDLTLFSVFS